MAEPDTPQDTVVYEDRFWTFASGKQFYLNDMPVAQYELDGYPNPGDATLDRRYLNGIVGTGTQQLRLTYFRSHRTEPITQVLTATSSTAASGGTLCRVGVYKEETNGDLTLVASTPTDTALWIAANTSYTKAFSATWNKIAGQRYAMGILFVGTTAPTYVGASVSAGTFGPTELRSPRIAAILSSQADLPASILNASLTTGGPCIFGEFIP